MSSLQRPSSKKSAFSLVEVVLAIGVVSFSLLALVGTLPTGIKSVIDSMGDSARANAIQQIRAELQQVSFGSAAQGNNSNNNLAAQLAAQTNFYSAEGLQLPDSTGAYYKAVFEASNAAIPGTSTTPVYFQSGSAQSIKVTLSYPQYASAENQQKSVLNLFVAKQKSY